MRIRTYLLCFISVALAMGFSVFHTGPGLPNEPYAEDQLNTMLSQNNTGKAVSSVVMHDGYLFVPLGSDGGGGTGTGAFHVYDVSDLKNPQLKFSSLDHPEKYHKQSSFDYVGNWAEIHALPIVDGQYFIVSERGRNKAGFSIFDPKGAYDDDSTTSPEVVSRFLYPGVNITTNYDGYSFSLATYGGKYVYSPTGANGLFVTDISDIENPKFVSHIPRSQLSNLLARSATVLGNWLILSDSEVGRYTAVLIMDISDPANPVQIGKIDRIKLGYQPVIYGAEFFPIDDGPLVSYDFSDPQNITVKNYNQFAGDLLFNPEYGFGKDDFLFVGHYPGMTKWSLTDIDGPVVSKVHPVNPSADDYAFITPIGNAIVVTSDHSHNNKLNFGVHDVNPDTESPKVKFVVPKDLTEGVSVNNGFGISFTDFIDPLTIDTSTLYLTQIGSNVKVPGSFSQLFGFVNFYPSEPLEKNTTYQIMLKAGGLKDWVGNGIEQDVVVSTFSTGSAVLTLPKIKATAPNLVGQDIFFEIDTSGVEIDGFQFSWEFGDGSPSTSFSTDLSITHQFSEVGNFTVTLAVKINEGLTQKINTTQTIHHPVSSVLPINSTTILEDMENGLVWNVNPDNNTISALDVLTLEKKYEVPVGLEPRGLALSDNGLLYVVNKEDATISVVNTNLGENEHSISLPYGSWPSSIIVDDKNEFVYVSLQAKNELLKLNLPNLSVIEKLKVLDKPGNMAFDVLNEKLYLSHFISPNESGKVTQVDLSDFSIERVIDLAIDQSPDGAENGRGLPNYLMALAISPDLKQLYVPSKKDNIERGIWRDGNDLTFEHTVRSIASKINLETFEEDLNSRIDFDNDDFATAVAYAPLGNRMFVTTNGTSRVHVVDAYNPESSFALNSGGLAPDGISVSEDGNRIYVHNYMSRSVSVLECVDDCNSYMNLANVNMVKSELLSTKVLTGKRLFYNSIDTRLAQDGYMSCSSCHLDGGSDGRVWDITTLGEGLRNTIDLRGKAGLSHGPLHWTANFDEVQDFEIQIRDLNSGTGLMTEEDYSSTLHALNDPKKTGRSIDLDALAAYVESLDNVLESPYRLEGNLTAQGEEGKVIFDQMNCVQCHGGVNYTNSQDKELFDIGTIKASSGKRLGEELNGFDVPTLRGLWFTSPYLHDGSAETISDAIEAHNGIELNEDELAKLESYLLQLDYNECAVLIGSECDDGNPRTENDRVDANCMCKGTLLACNGNDEVLYEVWENVNGSSVSDLLESDKYENSPSNFTVLTNVFEAVSPANLNNYGARLSGILCIPQTGTYRFYVSGDDATALYLSTDENLANAELIAYNTEKTKYREWDKYESQKSAEIQLEEGQQCYIYALNKEFNGQNFLSVGWELPNGELELPMKTNRISLPEHYDCEITYLSDEAIEMNFNGLGPIGIDESNGNKGPNDGSQITIKGDGFDKGLGVHAYSNVTYNLGGAYETFSSFIGVQRECYSDLPIGSVEFRIKGDGVSLYSSGVKFASDAPEYVEVSVKDVAVLELIVTESILGNECDNANWADAKLSKCSSCVVGASCDDGDACTINDVLSTDCQCIGSLFDADSNLVCDSSIVTSFDIYESTEIISVYPNPANDHLYFDFTNKTKVKSISVFDMKGRNVCELQVKLQSSNTAVGNVSDLVPGSYMIYIRTEEGVYANKFIKN